MSGIACARALQAAGLPVRLIDKGAGISGQKGIKARSHCWQDYTGQQAIHVESGKTYFELTNADDKKKRA